MSGLIQRLRHAADCQWKDVVDDCQEAANEIEQLEGANRVLGQWVEGMEQVAAARRDEIDRLRAEIERLRAGREHWYCENCGCERCIKAEGK